MKFIILLLNILYINSVFSGTYKVEAYMDTTISGDTKLPDNRTYRTFSLDGMWKDSLGDIGVIEAFVKLMKLETSYGVFLGEIVLMLKLGVGVVQYL